jgi:hypothetical protein
MSRKAPPQPPRDNETPKGPWVVQGIKQEWKLGGGPRAKEGRASIMSKENEEKWINEKKTKERKKE